MKTLRFGLCLVCLMWNVAHAQRTSASAPALTPNQAVSTSANLDFTIQVGKMLYFRVGDGVFPNANTTVNEVVLTPVPSFPTTPTTGNDQTTNWNGTTVPTMTTSNGVALPVEVRSNAGQINVRATVTSPLIQGSQTIPFSDIKITSGDSNLPAPIVPNSGTGASVNITPSRASNLVTERTATWTFNYVPTTTVDSGVYSGVLTFTASSL